MFTRIIPILLIIPVLMAACGGEAPTRGAEATVQEAISAPQATHTKVPPTETPALVPEEESVPSGLVSECTIVSSPMDPESPFEEFFAVTETDWVSGPETATLTIVEYGDFQ
ncbi:MAG: hypothetical protein FJ010_07335 [Chloroflexi bacterium]|nr:hypothetical protein [Chloroflexota bacterium]